MAAKSFDPTANPFELLANAENQTIVAPERRKKTASKPAEEPVGAANLLLLPKLKLERRRKLPKPPSPTLLVTIKANKNQQRRNSHVNSLKKQRGKEPISSVKPQHHLTCQPVVLLVLLVLVEKEE